MLNNAHTLAYVERVYSNYNVRGYVILVCHSEGTAGASLHHPEPVITLSTDDRATSSSNYPATAIARVRSRGASVHFGSVLVFILAVSLHNTPQQVSSTVQRVADR